MPTSHPYQDHPYSIPTVDEHHWIIHIRRSLDEDLDRDNADSPVSIFNVPNILLLASPESYIPQQIALGPYHHSRPELHEMERYKLTAAKRFQKRIHGLRFHNLVDHLILYEQKFRAIYHKYLNFNGETLAWMMAIDSCFLLDFLQAFTVDEKKIASRMSCLAITGSRSGHNAIVRDILMLENQVPLFLLSRMMKFQSPSSGPGDDALYSILTRFCNSITPLKMVIKSEPPDLDQLKEYTHLLDLLYHSIVPKLEGPPVIDEQDDGTNTEGETTSFRNIIGPSPAGLIKRLVFSKPIKLILALPLKIISNLPGVIMLRQLKHLFFPHENERNAPDNENRDEHDKYYKDHRYPLMEEMAIPSVSELSRAGIKFAASEKGIAGIGFDVGTATLQLPSVQVDVNAAAVLRNLVAYEACSGWGPLVLARYVELMNGIVDGADDVRLLRESGVILSQLRCDLDVAKLWNGMSRSVRMTEVPFLDRVIEDVNQYYGRRWRVKIGGFLGRRVFGWWRCMMLVGAVWVVGFMGLQGFCSVFGCFPQRKKMN